MLSHLLFGWAACTLGLWLAAHVLRGVRLTSFSDAIWAGALVSVLQWALTGPIFVALGIGTLGLGFLLGFITRWIASAFVVMIASALSSRLAVTGFMNALVTALIIAATSSAVRWLW